MEFIEDYIRSALLADPEVDVVNIEVVWDPVGRRTVSAPTRARRCEGWGSRYDRANETVWEVFARKAYEEPLHTSARSPSPEDLALISARSIYAAAVDRDDHRAAAVDPGGNQRMSTKRVDAATATMVSLIGSRPTTRARSVAATASGR